MIYHLEKYRDRNVLNLVASNRKMKTKIKSTELGVSLELRAKPDYKWWHPIGFWSKHWGKFQKSFDKKVFDERFSTTFAGVLYAAKKFVTIKNKIKYLNLPYTLLRHELYHKWQSKKYFAYSIRYGISKKFRLRIEIEAYIYGYKEDINERTFEHYVESITNSLTGGAYFGNIDRKMVEKEVRRQMLS